MKILVGISGPSGSGKSTLARHLAERTGPGSLYPYSVVPVVSHTTRAPRPGEVNGVDYYFCTEEEWAPASYWVEEIQFHGCRYGLHRDEADRHWEQGAVPVVILDPQGQEATARYCREHQIVFLAIYVGGDSLVLVDRYLSRLGAADLESPASRRTHASRLLALPDEVRNWRESFDRVGAEYDNPRITLQEYGPATQDIALQGILDALDRIWQFGSSPPGPSVQDLVTRWADRTFGKDRPVSKTIVKLFEELGEALKSPEDPTEWADVLILVYDLMARFGVGDPDRHVLEKLKTMESDTWVEAPTGVMTRAK